MAISLLDAVYDYLSSHASIVALVGIRIYPGIAPKSAIRPYITFNLLSARPTHHAGGSSGFVNEDIQIDAWGDNTVDVENVAEAVRESLDGMQTKNIGTPPMFISSAELRTKHIDMFAPTRSDQKAIYRASSDYTIWRSESVPTFA